MKELENDILRRIDESLPNRSFKILGPLLKVKDRVLVEDQYGLLTPLIYKLIGGITPSIISAVDQTSYYKNKLKEKFGDTYDLSKVVYSSKNSDNNITLICKFHGEFISNKTKLLNKTSRGCQKCDIIKRGLDKQVPFKKFLARSNKIHSNFYSYNEDSYTCQNNLIEITCPIHGVFSQTAVNHSNGQGCTECGRIRQGNALRVSTESFIEKGKLIYGDLYDYSKSVYTTSSKSLIITCKIHGDFKQPPISHYKGIGCQKCVRAKVAAKQTKTLEYFVERALPIHGDQYDYTKAKYISMTTPLEIVCKYHGSFFQSPVTHLNGSRCQKCSHLLSYYKSFISFADIQASANLKNMFYVLHLFSDSESFYKVGITANIKKRVRHITAKTSYEVGILYIQEDTVAKNCALEFDLLKYYKQYKYVPAQHFAGKTECFFTNPLETFKELML